MAFSRRVPADRLIVVFAIGCAIAAFLLLGLQLARLALPYDAEKHAWGSAHFATIARTYAEQGFLAVRGLPIGNNPPLGLEPDAYVHWPPLFAMVLGVVFELFGVSEAVARGFMLVVGAALVLATGWVAKLVGGPRAAVAAMFAVLTIPVFWSDVCLVQLTTLGIVFMVLATGAFLKATPGGAVRRRWAWLGLAWTVLAVLSSWEPVMLPAGLLVTALLERDRARVRLAFAHAVAVVVGVALVFGFYFMSLPGLWAEIWRTALYRTGLVAYSSPPAVTLHTLVNNRYYLFHPTFSELLGLYAQQLVQGLGFYLAALIAALMMAARRDRPRDERWTPWILAAPALLWFTLMSNQSVDNDFEILLFVPACAVSFAIALCAAWDAWRSRRGGRATAGAGVELAAVAVLACALMWPLWSAYRQRHVVQPATGMLEYARGIEDHTEPGAVVLSPLASLVPVYYSHRHIVRGITDGQALGFVLERSRTAFPGAPVYFAVPPENPPPAGLESRRVAPSERRVQLYLLRR